MDEQGKVEVWYFLERNTTIIGYSAATATGDTLLVVNSEGRNDRRYIGLV